MKLDPAVQQMVDLARRRCPVRVTRDGHAPQTGILVFWPSQIYPSTRSPRVRLDTGATISVGPHTQVEFLDDDGQVVASIAGWLPCPPT